MIKLLTIVFAFCYLIKYNTLISQTLTIEYSKNCSDRLDTTLSKIIIDSIRGNVNSFKTLTGYREWTNMESLNNTFGTTVFNNACSMHSIVFEPKITRQEFQSMLVNIGILHFSNYADVNIALTKALPVIQNVVNADQNVYNIYDLSYSSICIFSQGKKLIIIHSDLPLNSIEMKFFMKKIINIVY